MTMIRTTQNPKKKNRRTTTVPGGNAQHRSVLRFYAWFSLSSISFKHRTTIPIPSVTASLSLSITWLSTRANLSGCHRRSAARILSFDDTSGECAGDNKNSRMASGLNSSSRAPLVLLVLPSSGSSGGTAPIASATGQGIRSNVSGSGVGAPGEEGRRWLSWPQRASYELHAPATSRMRRRPSRSARCCCCCSCCSRFCCSCRCCSACRRRRASSAMAAARRASASRRASSRRRWSSSRARSSAARRCCAAR